MAWHRWLAAAALVPLLAFAAWAQVQDVSGEWDSNLGAMFIEQDGDQFNGQYDRNDGTFEGQMDGNVLRGIWTQTSARHRCEEERMGSEYWGRFDLRLMEDGRHFEGRRSWCDRELGSESEWKGERPRHR